MIKESVGLYLVVISTSNIIDKKLYLDLKAVKKNRSPKRIVWKSLNKKICNKDFYKRSQTKNILKSL
jgi:tRNA A-37 threonylcarbamoyl transferase component Bud32